MFSSVSSIDLGKLNLRPNVMFMKMDTPFSILKRTAEHNFRSIGGGVPLEVRTADRQLIGTVLVESGEFAPSHTYLTA